MHVSKLNPEFWNYLSETQKDLILEGDYLMDHVIPHSKHNFKDYSFLVFPYAKTYEGYLKQLFLDVHFINHLDYISDHFRLGKFLSPNLIDKLEDRSLFVQIREGSNNDIADRVWDAWKTARNQVFHYYPHNVKSVSYERAQEMSTQILTIMLETYEKLKYLM